MRMILMAAAAAAALAAAPPGARAEGAVHYCEGAGCPSRYSIEGFEVRVSPTVAENPAFSHQRLGRYLDVVQAQLVYLTSEHVLPAQAVRALRDSRLALHVDDGSNLSRWWPCSPGQTSCYSPRLNRIGALFFERSAGNVVGSFWWINFLLHEMAHAYHWTTVRGRFFNPCISAAFRRNRHRYAAVAHEAVALPGHPPELVQSHAYLDEREYFAKLSEAFFRTERQTAPTSRTELARHDPEGYQVVHAAWRDPAFCASAPARQPPAHLAPPPLAGAGDAAAAAAPGSSPAHLAPPPLAGAGAAE